MRLHHTPRKSARLSKDRTWELHTVHHVQHESLQENKDRQFMQYGPQLVAPETQWQPAFWQLLFRSRETEHKPFECDHFMTGAVLDVGWVCNYNDIESVLSSTRLHKHGHKWPDFRKLLAWIHGFRHC